MSNVWRNRLPHLLLVLVTAGFLTKIGFDLAAWTMGPDSESEWNSITGARYFLEKGFADTAALPVY